MTTLVLGPAILAGLVFGLILYTKKKTLSTEHIFYNELKSSLRKREY